MKFRLAFFFTLIGLVTSRPQSDYDETPLCSEYPGYRCVAEENCLSSQVFLEDQIFTDVFSDGAGSLQIRGQEKPEDAICEPNSIGSGSIKKTIIRSNDGLNDGLICCEEKNIQNEEPPKVPDCSQFQSAGYRCVPVADCGGSFGSQLDIRTKPSSNPRNVAIRAGSLDAENAVCAEKPETDHQFNPHSDGAGLFTIRGAETEVCCHEKDITEAGDVYDEDVKYCADYASEGYSCVALEECQGELDPRSSLFNDELACDKGSEICCHKDKLIAPKHPQVPVVPGLDDNLCIHYARDGYKCVPEDRCAPPDSIFNVRGAADDAQNAFCDDDGESKPDIGDLFSGVNVPVSTGIRSADSVEVCCHKDHVLPSEPRVQPVAQKCSLYARDRFKCVDETQCLDAALFNSDDGLKVDIRDEGAEGDYAPHLATCESDNQVCCLNIKQEPIFEEQCTDSPGYQCLPVTKCNLEDPVAQATGPRSVLDIRSGGFLDIDHLYSLCMGDDEICCSPEKQIKDKVKPPLILTVQDHEPQCGRHNGNGIGVRVLDPQDGRFSTQFGEWPHVCILMKINSVGQDDFIGGASLIASGIVITAAHKVNGYSGTPSSIKVRCGDWNVKNPDEYKKHQDRTVETISIHPRYSGIEEVQNDVALLHLSQDFDLDSHLDTICLPEYPDDRNGNYNKGKNDCSVQGWGKSAFGEGGEYQESLRQIELPIVENRECEQKLRKTRLPDDFDLHDSFLCAGGTQRGEDACEGDGGGPLVCRQDDRYVLAGIVAWGIGCGQPNVPGVYAAVTDAICWIDWVTKCKHGNEYAFFYNYPQCDNWIDKEISSLERSSDSKAKLYLNRVKIMKKTCQKAGKVKISPRIRS